MSNTSTTGAAGQNAMRKSRQLITTGFVILGIGVVVAFGEPTIGAAIAFFGWTFLLAGLIGWAVNDSPPKADD